MAQVAQLKKKFLELYPECYTVTDTCRAIGIGRRTLYNWLSKDTAFAKDYEHAKEALADKLEKAALEKALAKESDTLTIFLLKGLKPDRYGDKMQHNVAIQTAAQFQAELIRAAGSVA